MSSTLPVFRFGQFALDAAERQLLREGRPVALRPKSFETLLCLVERHGHLVTKDELLQRVWAETHVTDEVLTHCIAETRRALGDEARNPRFVKTVARAGYKFVGDVERARPAHEERSRASSTARATALAVLPFANLGRDPVNEFLCDGLAEELINGLTRLPTLRVVAHSSSFSFKGCDTDVREIGRLLGVDAIVEGSVRRAGGRLRVAAQLVRAIAGCRLWAEQYDRAIADAFAVQDEIARAILDRLGTELQKGGPASPPPGSRPTSPETYGLYLKGRSHWHRRFGGGLEQAMASFAQVIEADPRFAPAYAGLANCYATLGTFAYGAPADIWPKASALATTALALDDALAEAHGLRALVAMFYEWDWAAAAGELARALDLHPGSALLRLWNGHYLSVVGRFDEAIAETLVAQDLDPLSPVTTANLGWTYLLAGEHALAREALDRVLSGHPDNAIAHFYLGFVHAAAGRIGEGVSALGRAWTASGGMPYVAESIAWLRGLRGEREAATAALHEAGRRATAAYVPPSAIALIHLGLRNDAEVLDWLERALVGRDPIMPWLKFMPGFERVRRTSRFQDILRGIGLE